MLEVIDGRGRGGPVYVARPKLAGVAADPAAAVASIVGRVRAEGDRALLALTERLDDAILSPGDLRVDETAIDKARRLVRPDLVAALEALAARLRQTSARQVPETWIQESDDELAGELVRPLRRVGIYAPGGRAAYPSSVVMAAIPAAVAGVGAVAVCSPPGPDGAIAEPVLAACAVAGVTEVYRMGGAQAIAAFAYGTETVRPVDKVVGPGNIYVTLAKRLVQGWVGIDTEAGPTELMIVAGDGAAADVIAADLVAQAEHGPLGSHVLVTWSSELAGAVGAELELAVARHERSEDVENALIEGGRAVLVDDRNHALATANSFAPEHLQLFFEGARDALGDVRNAGAVFLGPMSPVPVGDYAGGTNHILPSGGAARWASGLGAQDFVKRIYVSGIGRGGLERLLPHVESLAEAEGLHGHGRAARVRLGRRMSEDGSFREEDFELASDGGKVPPPAGARKLTLSGGPKAPAGGRVPLRVRNDLAGVEPYASPQRPARYRMNTNESPHPPSEELTKDIAEAISRLELNRYPDKDARSLTGALASHMAWDPAGVWAANGSNEVLLHLFLAYGGAGRTAMTFEPTYSLHSLIPRITGTSVVSAARDDDFEIDLEAAVQAIAERPPDIIMACSPNNPTGVMEPLGSLEALLEEAPGIVVADEAYVEFADGGEGARDLLDRHHNLVLTRSFSKAWRLAGARLGYLVADPELVAGIGRVRLPYHLSALTQAVGEAALRHPDDAAATARLVARERDRIAMDLQSMGVKTIPSRANFVLFEVGDPETVWSELLDRDVLVRVYPGVPRLGGCLRVTVGRPEENDAFREAIRDVLGD